MMREFVVGAALAVVVAWGFNAGLDNYLERRELLHQVAVLENHNEHLRGMVGDARILAENMERRVAVVETEYTTREFLWLMRDVFAEAGVLVEVH